MNRFYTTPGFLLSKLFMIIPSFRLVAFILRVFKNKIGKNVSIHSNVRFILPLRLTIGNNVTINTNTLIDSRAGITIDENTMIGRDCKLYTLTHDTEDIEFKTIGKAIYIGKNVVIFPSAMIMPGVTIGDGAVVYPGSIVTKDVKPYSKVAGVPAKKVGTRQLRTFNYKLTYKMYFGV